MVTIIMKMENVFLERLQTVEELKLKLKLKGKISHFQKKRTVFLEHLVEKR